MQDESAMHAEELLQTLSLAVQRNCHIADARHAADAGMCTYLLRMREFYRWEQAIPLGGAIDRERLGCWLEQREALWEELAEQDFAPLSILGEQFDPFDIRAINEVLRDFGVAYSGGLEHGGRPSFFLAELVELDRRDDDMVLYVTDRELARCIHATPAMTRQQHIFLRRESLRRYLFEKYETWQWHRPDNALGRALACYPFEQSLELALDQMVNREMGAMRAHERGEYDAGRRLGEDWERMVLDLAFTPAERMARAVRDHLADCTHTLPYLVAEERQEGLHFFAGNFTAMRKHLFPTFLAAYERWHRDGDLRPLADLAERGAVHWGALAEEMLDLHRQQGTRAAASIAALVEARRF